VKIGAPSQSICLPVGGWPNIASRWMPWKNTRRKRGAPPRSLPKCPSRSAAPSEGGLAQRNPPPLFLGGIRFALAPYALRFP
jgi:hypothetical protein